MCNIAVAPLVGAWIEMPYDCDRYAQLTSLLSWERGLKSTTPAQKNTMSVVAPLVGAWIEIPRKSETTPNKDVAPLVGAWIEIYGIDLKSTLLIVAPLVGAWIEIYVD